MKDVEVLVMKALSLELINGYIDEVINILIIIFII